MDPVTITFPTTHVIVIVEDEERMIPADLCLRIFYALADEIRIKFVSETNQHVHGQLKFIVLCAAVPLIQLLNVGQIRFADEDAISWILVDHGTKATHYIVHLWQIVIERVVLIRISVSVGAFKHLCIAQLWVFEESGNG